MDMDDPFFRTHWNQPSRPRYSPSFRGIPVQRQASTATATKPSSSSSPKVVSIPVHFVGSERSRSASALKIQKVFRGYLVRKSVKRIVSIKNEVDEIERRIWSADTIDLIRRDAKERLRVNETLMALLFKLDSVRGVDSGVRDFRKAVIKKAIMLQERVDAIVSGDLTVGNSDALEVDESESDAPAGAVDQTVEIRDSTQCIGDSAPSRDETLEIEGNSSEIDHKTKAVENSVNTSSNSVIDVLQTPEIDGECREALDQEGSNCVEGGVDDVHKVNLGEIGAMPEAKDETTNFHASEGAMESPRDCESMDCTEVGVDFEEKADEETCVVKRTVENATTPPLIDCGEESGETTSPTEEDSLNQQSSIEGSEENTTPGNEEDKMEIGQVDQTEEKLAGGGRDDNKRNREILEKMMEDNEKMMNLMTQLFERNEAQTRMLSSLSQRVEQLEKAFISDKLRRKKKRHGN